MANRLKTYQAIAKILDSESSIEELRNILSQPRFDWDNLVVEGSRHLVLPALYCNLLSKNVLSYLPEGLETYLEELATINRNRNLSITSQAKEISRLFELNDIQHVFLKGTAFLLADIYKDYAERMIGDIDILIERSQLKKAFDLLLEQGYHHDEPTFGSAYTEHKHLPRLRSENGLAAVELHHKLFVKYKITHLTNSELLAKKEFKQELPIPSTSQMMWHAILNFQINDRGYWFKTINFRTSNDVNLLLKRYDPLEKDFIFRNKPAISFFERHLLLFNEPKVLIQPLSGFAEQLFLIRLRFKRFDHSLLRLKHVISYFGILFKRLWLFISKQRYRQSLWKDRHRVFKLLHSQLLHQKKPD